jgi:hypothetical protein
VSLTRIGGRCGRCGKGGLFHKVGASGFCKKCEQIKLSEAVEKLKIDYAKEEEAINTMKKNRENLYKEIEGKVRQDMAVTIASTTKELEEKRNQIIVFDETIMLESFALYQPKFKFFTSEEYKQKFDAVREQEKLLIKQGMVASCLQEWTVRGSAAEGKKMVEDMKKLLIRSFNNECDACVDNVKFNNMAMHEKRIEKSFETINKLGRVMNVEISKKYKELKLTELALAYEYQVKKAEGKEATKKAREELREQQKMEREIKEAREKINKEKKHFSVAIKDLEIKLEETTDEQDRTLIIKNLEEAKAQCAALDQEEKIVDYREQNAKAGYVYIISNIGSFGEGVYKIGMTRRLEPQERVDELGDASVPFKFDVHALIFSDNAPELEAKLHEHFYNKRLNKLNNRKEFFRADINEIETVIKQHYHKVIDVVKEAAAEQYRETLLIEKSVSVRFNLPSGRFFYVQVLSLS